jgi:hypothetical protein
MSGYVSIAVLLNTDFHIGYILFCGSNPSLLNFENKGYKTVLQALIIIPTNGSSIAPFENSANVIGPKYLLIKN